MCHFWQVHIRFSEIEDVIRPLFKPFGTEPPLLRGTKLFDMSNGLSPELVQLRRLDVSDHIKIACKILGNAQDYKTQEQQDKLRELRKFFGIPASGEIAGEGAQVQVRVASGGASRGKMVVLLCQDAVQVRIELSAEDDSMCGDSVMVINASDGPQYKHQVLRPSSRHSTESECCNIDAASHPAPRDRCWSARSVGQAHSHAGAEDLEKASRRQL